MIVINLFGGPGTGKSTTAAGLFCLMKNAGIKVELVTEYAKDIVWAARHKELDDQLYILAKQHHRLHILKNQVDYAITDSPILLSSVYGSFMPQSFHDLIKDLYLYYDNRHIILNRVKPYAKFGRNQTEQEARDLDEAIKSKVEGYVFGQIEEHKKFVTPANAEAPRKIFHWLAKQGEQS